MPDQDATLDPIKLEVIRNGLTAAADEMALALQRAAYSTNIKTRLDFSCAIFDPGEVSARATFDQPNVLATGMQRVLVNGVAALRDGAATGERGGRTLRAG